MTHAIGARHTVRAGPSSRVSSSRARRALAYGLALWVIPFAISLVIYPLKQAGSPLFETLMALALTGSALVFGVLWFRGVREDPVVSGLKVGLLWLAISLLIDAPLFLIGGPMLRSVPDYMADIGLSYLVFPMVCVGMGAALKRSGW